MSLLLALALYWQAAPPHERLQQAARLWGLELTEREARAAWPGVQQNRRRYERLRRISLPNAVPPAWRFDPFQGGPQILHPPPQGRPLRLPSVKRPDRLEELYFAPLPVLAALVKSRQVRCVELTRLYLRRLREVDRTLHCVITYTEKRALERAEALDRELAAGRWRGVLHGIPYGAKDVFATRGYPTTWGARPFADRMLDYDAAVIERLDAAGAVLVAKLSLGALAMGDVWFGGRTRNPWRPAQGSSGSSAGSAAAVAAGALPFALGTETLGSLVSPSNRCGVSSIRPTFGRVSRYGAMALSWSMDKVGPMARSLEDAALVLEAIAGPDGRDPTTVPTLFRYPGDVDVRGWRVGYLPDAARGPRSTLYRRVLKELEGLGIQLVPVKLPDFPLRDLLIILDAEAAAAFDTLTRTNLDDRLTRQDPRAWPNRFRVARFIPAVEYIQAQRIRTLLLREVKALFARVPVIVHPPFAGGMLVATNLTGHPTVTAPAGFGRDGTPRAICFTGRLLGEAEVLAVAVAWQKATPYHRRRPPRW